MKLVEDLENDWTCECGNDKLNGNVEFNKDTQTNEVIYRCSECGKKVAYSIIG